MDKFSPLKTFLLSILDTIKKEKSIIEKEIFNNFFLNDIGGTSKIKKELHTKYEVRFFWPDSAFPRINDLYGLIFNEKDYIYEKIKDKYIITENNFNIKIRKQELQIKTYNQEIGNVIQVSKKKKIKFPIMGKRIASLLNKKLDFESEFFHTSEDLLRSLGNLSNISLIEVKKERYVRKMKDHTCIEFSLIKIQEKCWKTICIESPDLQKIQAFSLLIHQEGAKTLSYNDFLRQHSSEA